MLIFCISLAFVITVLAIAMGMQLRKKIASNALAMEVAKANSENRRALLETLMSKVNDGATSVSFRHDKYYGEKYFIEQLMAAFKGKISILHKNCNIPEKGNVPICSTVYGVETDQGTILVYASAYNSTFKLHKQKVGRYTGNFPVEDYVEEGDMIQLYGELMVVLPNTMDEKHPDHQKLLLIMEDSQLEEVTMEIEEGPSKVLFWNLVKTVHGNYTLQTQSRDVRPIPKALLNLSYQDVDIQYEGTTVKVPMGDAARIVAACIENKENISIFGVKGGGKSFLQDEFARQTSRKGLAIIYVSPAMLHELQSVTLLPDLVKELQRLKEDTGKTPVFIIDEAESLLEKTESGIHSLGNSFMLSLLDGQIQKLLNCSCILTFNCPPEQLNPAAFREMRMGMQIFLGYLPREKADQLTEYLKEQNPTFIFDRKRWERLRQEDITLAKVYVCFNSPSKQRVITDVLAQYIPELKAKLEAQAASTPAAVPKVMPPVRTAMAHTDTAPLPSASHNSLPNPAKDGKRRNKDRRHRKNQ